MKKAIFAALVLMAILLTACQSHEHSYGTWIVKTTPTCTAEGIRERVCSCGEAETQTIAKLSHEFGEWVTTTEASCTADGEKTRTCSCGETQTEKISKGKHTYGDWTTTKKATCSKEGVQERSCTICGEKDQGSISKTAHNWKDATCASPKKCSACGATEGKPTAHDYPDSDFKCKTCGQKVYASDYEYLAGSDFRGIRSQYSAAQATNATMIMYRDAVGDVCILVKVYYKIGEGSFDDLYLHNLTKGQRIEDPESYYEKLKNRAFGNAKLTYIALIQGVLECELDMMQGKNSYVVSGSYLNM